MNEPTDDTIHPTPAALAFNYRANGIETSTTTGKLYKQLALAQTELKNPGFDSINPHFRSKYASLAATLQGARECLSKHGICIMQPTVCDCEKGLYGCETILAFEDEWIRSTTLLPLAGEGRQSLVQEIGGNFTYSKKYGITSLLAIAGEEDHDGNLPEEDNDKTSTTKTTPKPKEAGSHTRPVPQKPVDWDKETGNDEVPTDGETKKDAAAARARAECILKVKEWSDCKPEYLGRCVTAVAGKMNLRKGMGGSYSTANYLKIAEYAQGGITKGVPWQAIVPFEDKR